MLINSNGISIMADVNNKTLSFVVLEQSAAATKIIKDNEIIVDPDSGYGLRVNKYPALNCKDKKKSNHKNFYLRGSDTTNDRKLVVYEFLSATEAEGALDALELLVSMVVAPTKTCCGSVPPKTGTKPIRKSTVTGSKSALKAARKFFQDGLTDGSLVERWRLATSWRSNDAAYPNTNGFTIPSGKCLATNGKVCSGKIDSGKGETVDSGKVVDGKIISGKVSTGKVSNGKVSAGKIASVDSGKELNVVNSGIVTLIRRAVITKEMASVLRLTDHTEWPNSLEWNKVDKVTSTGNEHADEHYGIEQGGAGILNLASE